MTDPLVQFYVHQITLNRLTDSGDGFGKTYGPDETPMGFVQDGNRLVRSTSGDQVVSSSQFTTSLANLPGFVPEGSQVTLPATFGGRTTTVIGCEVADGGGLPTPDHVTLLLE